MQAGGGKANIGPQLFLPAFLPPSTQALFPLRRLRGRWRGASSPSTPRWAWGIGTSLVIGHWSLVIPPQSRRQRPCFFLFPVTTFSAMTEGDPDLPFEKQRTQPARRILHARDHLPSLMQSCQSAQKPKFYRTNSS